MNYLKLVLDWLSASRQRLSKRLKLVTMQVARRPCEPDVVMSPSMTANSITPRFRNVSRIALKSSSAVSQTISNSMEPSLNVATVARQPASPLELAFQVGADGAGQHHHPVLVAFATSDHDLPA